MHIAILTFDGFNELDSLIAFGMLSRITLLGDTNWRVSIASPTARVTSMNGLTLDAHIDLHQATTLDAYARETGELLWRTELYGIGPVGHSKYFNDVELRFEGGNVVV